MQKDQRKRIFSILFLLMVLIISCQVSDSSSSISTGENQIPTAISFDGELNNIVQSTANSNTPTVMPTSQEASSHPVSTEEPTPLPYYTLEPANTSYYFENFDRENVPYWDLDHKPLYWTEKKDGALFVYFAQQNTMAEVFPSAFELSDGMMTAWAEVIEESGEVFYGMACRATSDPLSYYGFWISSEGRYQAQRVEPGSIEILFRGESTAIHQGHALNGIQLYCRNGRMIFYVNGQVLGEIERSDLSGGSFGLLAGTSSGTSGGVVKYDHIDISYPSGN